MEFQFANRLGSLQASAIREILKFTSDPEVISFAAGNPAPEAFPLDEVKIISDRLLHDNPIGVLQYGVSEGFTPLRDLLKVRFAPYIGEDEELIITSGAQQAMDLCCKALCNEGDTVLCEAPSFVGSLNAFRSYGVNLVGIETDEAGIALGPLEEALQTQSNPRILYLIPNFQNPTGRCMARERREAVYALAQRYGVLIIEDNPYGDLRFVGEDLPHIKAFDKGRGNVLYVGSFSKVIAPGIRVAYCFGAKALLQKLVVCKQVSDVHTNNYAQLLAYHFLHDYDFDLHLARLRNIYRHKASLMLTCMEKEFSSRIRFTRPEGGLFLWCSVPHSMQLFAKRAVEECKVAVVPGTAFLTSEALPCESFRLNYSTPTDEEIQIGIQRLGALAKEMYA